MGTRVSSRQLVGRDQPLGLLVELVQRAADGDGGRALVVGEAGIGKSRLLSEFSRRAGEQGALVLTGGCVDLAEVELPYAPIVGALRSVVRDRNEAELVRLFGGARAELARLLPELGDADPALPGPLGQTRLFELVLGTEDSDPSFITDIRVKSSLRSHPPPGPTNHHHDQHHQQNGSIPAAP